MTRRTLVLALLAASSVVRPSHGQDQVRPALTTAVSGLDWGIQGPEGVRFGRLATVDLPEGPRLEVRRISEVPAVQASTVPVGHTPAFSGNTLIVADFSQANRTGLGGFFGTFQRSPSLARAYVRRGSDGRRALEMEFTQQSGGFSGLWIQTYDAELPKEARSYLDTRAFTTLSFWVRGGEGGERILLKVADPSWEAREDAVVIGEVASFLPSGRLEPGWQQAIIPMDRFPVEVRRDALALVVFEAGDEGISKVELGPMGFSIETGGLPELPPPIRAAAAPVSRQKATWFWDTGEFLENPDLIPPLLEFLEEEGFNRVFLQLPGDQGRGGLLGELAIDVETMRPLVSGLNAKGIRVFALDGYPRYALPEYHTGVLSTIGHVAEYNSAVLPTERFFGVRYDIEPYLLPAFHGPGREALLGHFLNLIEASVQSAHESGLVFGADIPFWYDVVSDDRHQQVTATFNGETKVLSEHVIDLVDEVAIMDYRTVAHGADGTVRHGTGELQYASRQGKPVLIGLETGPLPDEVLFEFGGEPEVGIPSAPTATPVVLAAPARDSIQVILIRDTGSPSAFREAIESWMEEKRLGPEGVRWWSTTRTVEVPGEKLSFAGQSPEMLEEVMRATAEEFGFYPSFAGFAVHHAGSYRTLLRR